MKTTVESKSLLGFNFTPCFFSSSQEVFWFLFLPSHFTNHLIEKMSSFPPGTLSAFSCLQHQERYEYNIFLYRSSEVLYEYEYISERIVSAGSKNQIDPSQLLLLLF